MNPDAFILIGRMPGIGQDMFGISVYVKAYLKKNGDASYILCVQKDYLLITKGEAF